LRLFQHLYRLTIEVIPTNKVLVASLTSIGNYEKLGKFTVLSIFVPNFSALGSGGIPPVPPTILLSDYRVEGG
jgi:hypothetical protein